MANDEYKFEAEDEGGDIRTKINAFIEKAILRDEAATTTITDADEVVFKSATGWFKRSLTEMLLFFKTIWFSDLLVAKTVYVDATGNDETGTGEFLNPFATIERAICDYQYHRFYATLTVVVNYSATPFSTDFTAIKNCCNTIINAANLENPIIIIGSSTVVHADVTIAVDGDSQFKYTTDLATTTKNELAGFFIDQNASRPGWINHSDEIANTICCKNGTGAIAAGTYNIRQAVVLRSNNYGSEGDSELVFGFLNGVGMMSIQYCMIETSFANTTNYVGCDITYSGIKQAGTQRILRASGDAMLSGGYCYLENFRVQLRQNNLLTGAVTAYKTYFEMSVPIKWKPSSLSISTNTGTAIDMSKGGEMYLGHDLCLIDNVTCFNLANDSLLSFFLGNYYEFYGSQAFGSIVSSRFHLSSIRGTTPTGIPSILYDDKTGLEILIPSLTDPYYNKKNPKNFQTVAEVQALGVSYQFVFCAETGKIYRYDETSAVIVDNNFVLNTADGGDTRFVSIDSSLVSNELFIFNVGAASDFASLEAVADYLDAHKYIKNVLIEIQEDYACVGSYLFTGLDSLEITDNGYLPLGSGYATIGIRDTNRVAVDMPYASQSVANLILDIRDCNSVSLEYIGAYQIRLRNVSMFDVYTDIDDGSEIHDIAVSNSRGSIAGYNMIIDILVVGLASTVSIYDDAGETAEIFDIIISESGNYLTVNSSVEVPAEWEQAQLYVDGVNQAVYNRGYNVSLNATVGTGGAFATLTELSDFLQKNNSYKEAVVTLVSDVLAGSYTIRNLDSLILDMSTYSPATAAFLDIKIENVDSVTLDAAPASNANYLRVEYSRCGSVVSNIGADINSVEANECPYVDISASGRTIALYEARNCQLFNCDGLVVSSLTITNSNVVSSIKTITAITIGAGKNILSQPIAATSIPAPYQNSGKYYNASGKCLEVYMLSSKPLNNGIVEKIIVIPPWNMDTTPSLAVPHGLSVSESKTINVISATIREDADTYGYPINSVTGGSLNGAFGAITDTSIYLEMIAGSVFDDTDFDDDTINRGYMLISYIPDAV